MDCTYSAGSCSAATTLHAGGHRHKSGERAMDIGRGIEERGGVLWLRHLACTATPGLREPAGWREEIVARLTHIQSDYCWALRSLRLQHTETRLKNGPSVVTALGAGERVSRRTQTIAALRVPWPVGSGVPNSHCSRFGSHGTPSACPLQLPRRRAILQQGAILPNKKQ